MTVSSKKRFLFYSPYGAWDLHTLYEITIAYGLRHRGAEIKFVGCNGQLPSCDVAWDSRSPKTASTCFNCIKDQTELFYNHHFPLEWLGQYISNEDRSDVEAWVCSQPSEHLLNSCYDGYPLGLWVKSSVHSNFRDCTLDFEIPEYDRQYRNYLRGAALTLCGMRRCIAQYEPDAVFMLNGRFFSHRVVFELARANNIRVLTHERGMTDQTLRFWNNETAHRSDGHRKIWGAWKDIPLTIAEIHELAQLLTDREAGRNIGHKSFRHAPTNSSQIFKALNIPGNKSIISLFPSSTDETAALAPRNEVMNQFDWMRRTAAFFSDKDRYHLVIRLHPNLDGQYGKNASFYRKFEETVQPFLPLNASIVWPKDDLNSFALARASQACLVFSSTMGVDIACLGKPVLMCSHSLRSGHSWSLSLEFEQEYEFQLAQLLRLKNSAVRMRDAFRFAHFYYLRRSIKFPLVKVLPGGSKGELQYASGEDLLPGRDKALDKICDWAMGEAALYDLPTSVEYARPEEGQ